MICATMGCMSNVLGRTPAKDESRTLPRGETIGNFQSYLDAQKAVDFLADSKFPVQRVSILGNELKTVERVTGRLSYPKVALASAATGAWFGFFVGLILMLFGDGETYLSIVPAMALGAVFWMLFGVITYAFQRGKRDFTSTSQVVASSYDVIVEPQVAGEARRLLGQLPMNSAHGGNVNGPYASQPYGAPVPPQSVPPQPGTPQPVSPQRGQASGPDGGTPAGGMPPQQPAQEPPVGAAGQPEAQADSADARRGRFPDLPDGRPRYGVRVEPQAAPPGQPPTPPNEDPAQPPAAEK
jgi:hypothetical protein